MIEYKGCRNCKYQIEPLRTCEWFETVEHKEIWLKCPRWEPKDKLQVSRND